MSGRPGGLRDGGRGLAGPAGREGRSEAVPASVGGFGRGHRRRAGAVRQTLRVRRPGRRRTRPVSARAFDPAGLHAARLYRVRSDAFAYTGPYADVTSST
ncbi:hypothetical protein ACIO7M_07910 [Streptomyces toxytricini]|uniref:Uncharacterized protein n=1 Tax=Streptomyces toxytricini TaxID=67369 RepID=A0ABW8ECR4_STRT5